MKEQTAMIEESENMDEIRVNMVLLLNKMNEKTYQITISANLMCSSPFNQPNKRQAKNDRN